MRSAAHSGGLYGSRYDEDIILKRSDGILKIYNWSIWNTAPVKVRSIWNTAPVKVRSIWNEYPDPPDSLISPGGGGKRSRSGTGSDRENVSRIETKVFVAFHMFSFASCFGAEHSSPFDLHEKTK